MLVEKNSLKIWLAGGSAARFDIFLFFAILAPGISYSILCHIYNGNQTMIQHNH